MHIGKRIKLARKKREMSQGDLGKALGIERATVSSWENENSEPRTRLHPVLCRELHVSLTWLLTGREDQYNTSDIAGTTIGMKPVPVIDYVSAGNFEVISNPYEAGDGQEFVSVDTDIGPRCFALEIDGNSMSPEFNHGDKVVFDPDAPILPGDYVAAKLDSEEKAVFKKYRPRGVDDNGQEIIELAPENDDFPTLIINYNNPGRIIAKAIRHLRKL